MDDEAREIREALQSVSLFSDVLRSDQLDDLARACSSHSLPAGSILIRQGDVAASMFCIIGGIVSVMHVDAHRRTSQIRRLGAGSVVGEIELLTGERRLATVTTVNDVQVLEILAQALQNALAEAPDLRDAFGSVTSIRQAMLNQITDNRRAPLKSRILRQIRRILPRNGDHPDRR